MRIESCTVDAHDPAALARWWADALDWVVVHEEDDEVALAAEVRLDGSHPYPELAFVRVARPEQGRERVHLDLNSHSWEEQAVIVARLVAHGARHGDVGQAPDSPFVVLADPEGNHLCVLDPRPQYAHLGSLAGFTLAAHDAASLRDLWVAATGWSVARDEPGYVVLSPPPGGLGVDLEIITRPTMPRRHAKDRVHLDVAPGPDDEHGEVVDGLLALGATRTQVGQTGDESWVVLADPEGNELCVLTPRT